MYPCTSHFEVMCSNGDVRLVDGPEDRKYEGRNYEGRLEICHGGEWGTICDNDINNASATVVCKQLNLSSHGKKESTSLIFNML